MILESAAPFHITAGQDLYGDTLFNARPGITVETSRTGLIPTKDGLRDPNAIPRERILPRNFGWGPGLILANLRVTKRFAFGPARETSAPATGGRRLLNRSSLPPGRLDGHPQIVNYDNPRPTIGNVTSPLFGRANQPYRAGSLGETGFSQAVDNRRLELPIRFGF